MSLEATIRTRFSASLHYFRYATPSCSKGSNCAVPSAMGTKLKSERTVLEEWQFHLDGVLAAMRVCVFVQDGGSLLQRFRQTRIDRRLAERRLPRRRYS